MHVRPYNDDPISGFADLLGLLWRNRLWLMFWLLVCVGLGALYLYDAVPQYEATTQLVLEPRRPIERAGDASGVDFGPTLDSAQADSQAQVVKSERVLRVVFDALDLANDPTYTRQAPSLMGSVMSLFGRGSQNPMSPDERAAIARAVAFQAFLDRVSVRRIGQSYVLEVSVRALHAAEAAKLANAVTAAYILDQVQFQAATVQRGTEFLQNRIADIKTEVQIAREAVRTGIIPDAQFPDSDARVVSAALEPLGKAYPRSTLVILLAGVFGLLIGTTFVILRARLDRTIRSRRQIERTINVQNVHVLPRWQAASPSRAARMELTPTIVIEAETSPFTEALRILRTAILSGDKSPRHVALGVVSWSSGEGRSVIASNLAFLVGASRERVCLIDADFRNPALSRALAPDAPRGLDEALLAHDALIGSLGLALNRNVDIVPAVAGGKTSNPNVFTGSAEMQQFLRALHTDRDVIVDLPPMSMSSDTQAIGHLLDGVILVVEADRTTIDELNDALRALRGANTRVLSVLVNKVSVSSQRRGVTEAVWIWLRETKGGKGARRRAARPADRPFQR